MNEQNTIEQNWDDEPNLENAIFAIDSHAGIYCGNAFYNRYKSFLNLSNEDAAIMEDVDHENHIDVWVEIMDRGITMQGQEYEIYQDMDVWLIPVE